MKITLLAYTQLTKEFRDYLINNLSQDATFTDGQAISLSAIRTCYSSNLPSEIIVKEGQKYFGKKATDGEGGTEADRLIRHIMKSGHLSTTEHLNFTFAIEGVSRSLLAQITRHRHLSFSVQSQRYVKFGSNDKSGGFDHIIPESFKNLDDYNAEFIYAAAMQDAQRKYDELRKSGVPAEDARMVLPNAATCNLVMTGNLRSILDFCSKRLSKQAQWEIRELAEKLKDAVVEVEPWTESFFTK